MWTSVRGSARSTRRVKIAVGDRRGCDADLVERPQPYPDDPEPSTASAASTASVTSSMIASRRRSVASTSASDVAVISVA